VYIKALEVHNGITNRLIDTVLVSLRSLSYFIHSESFVRQKTFHSHDIQAEESIVELGEISENCITLIAYAHGFFFKHTTYMHDDENLMAYSYFVLVVVVCTADPLDSNLYPTHFSNRIVQSKFYSFLSFL
jgi:hypothetical protein